MSRRTIAVLLTMDGAAESTATALQLVECLMLRGHRVTVYAAEAAAGLTAGDSEVTGTVAALLRRGVHGGNLDWVVDEAATRRLGVDDRCVPGVVPGSPSDLWAFVRAADLVLSPGKA
ncbi:MAG: hypothetical protein M3425_06425 [Actinomycetota bacterium]|nr:hypothetical protein [Actinomycetota bacterium]